MLHALRAAVVGVPAGLQDIVEADEVGFDIDVRMVDAVPHPRLGGEVDDDVEAKFAE